MREKFFWVPFLNRFKLTSNAKKTHRRTLRVESLEDRQMLSVNAIAWNLGDYDYTNFLLSTDTEDNTVDLSGVKGDQVTLLESQSLEAGGTLTISGTDAAETLEVTYLAMENLGEVIYYGGKGQKDTLLIGGSENNDCFMISNETQKITTPLYSENPYEKLLDRYEERYGKNRIYDIMKKSYDRLWDRFSQYVKTTTSQFDLVELENGAQFKLTGIGEVQIDAMEGDDTFVIDSLSTHYILSGNDGEDTLDFSDAEGRLNLDMGATRKQSALTGNSGTLRLNNDMESVNGTQKADRITARIDGSRIVGNGGQDTVILLGGQNDVELTGARQSVTVRGSGEYSILIEDGDHSVINAQGATKDATVFVTANGDNSVLYGGSASVVADMVGDGMKLYCASGAQAQLSVTGNRGVIQTGKGADWIQYNGNNGTVKTSDGDDYIEYVGSGATIYAGKGNDRIELADGTDTVTGKNRVYGEAGNDQILTQNASGNNFLYAGAGNDLVIGGAGNDQIYGTSGNNILVGLGGSDRIYGGTGRDILLASYTDNIVDLESDPEGLETLFANLWDAWVIDDDMEQSIALLGEASVSDGARDWLYRGGGKGNLFYANKDKNDFTNPLAKDKRILS